MKGKGHSLSWHQSAPSQSDRHQLWPLNPWKTKPKSRVSLSRQGQQDKEFEQVASVQQGSRQTCFGLVNTCLLGRLPTFS
jgi:hypothetical protein